MLRVCGEQGNFALQHAGRGPKTLPSQPSSRTDRHWLLPAPTPTRRFSPFSQSPRFLLPLSPPCLWLLGPDFLSFHTFSSHTAARPSDSLSVWPSSCPGWTQGSSRRPRSTDRALITGLGRACVRWSLGGLFPTQVGTPRTVPPLLQETPRTREAPTAQEQPLGICGGHIRITMEKDTKC